MEESIRDRLSRFYSGILEDEEVDIRVRLRAAELLGKLHGADKPGPAEDDEETLEFLRQLEKRLE